MNKKLLLCLTALLAPLGLSAGEVRLNGASTTVNAVINPHKAAVEAATGLTLKVAGTNTGKGLVALVQGHCDASLTSEPLDIAYNAGILAAKLAGVELAAQSEYQIHEVQQDTVVWIVHPSNPVDNLTRDQIKAIHTGKITNWKDVGGPDLPIVVFTDAVTGGTRALLRQLALDGENYSASCKPLESVRLIVPQVAELKNGFGGVGAGFVDATKVKVLKSAPVPRPLGFITKGAPTADVQKVIDAFKATAK